MEKIRSQIPSNRTIVGSRRFQSHLIFRGNESQKEQVSNQRANKGFVDCVEELSLKEVSYTGSCYTWTNRRGGLETLAAKLDSLSKI